MSVTSLFNPPHLAITEAQHAPDATPAFPMPVDTANHPDQTDAALPRMRPQRPPLLTMPRSSRPSWLLTAYGAGNAAGVLKKNTNDLPMVVAEIRSLSPLHLDDFIHLLRRELMLSHTPPQAIRDVMRDVEAYWRERA